jgi:hypothetical protein
MQMGEVTAIGGTDRGDLLPAPQILSGVHRAAPKSVSICVHLWLI